MAAQTALAQLEDRPDPRAPDHAEIFRQRANRLAWVRSAPARREKMRTYYRTHIADFLTEWACTYDPRARAKGRPGVMPFILFQKQREAVDWILSLWRADESGIWEKSREEGASWIALCTSAALCIFDTDISVGFGSATEDNVDERGNPDSLFWKGQMFLDLLPGEFRPVYEKTHMRMVFPATNGTITGDAGANIGRGGRKSIFFLDEAAHIMHALAVDSALSAVTECRIDISSVSIEGMANHFAVRRHSGEHKIFTLHWRDDPRKSEEWAAKKKASLDPIVWAADYDIDYQAAAEGVIIPQAWVQAAIGAHEKLGIRPTGDRRGALDVADEGRDLNCFASRHGWLVTSCDPWSGKDSDIYATTEKAIGLCDDLQLDGFHYDADGLGAGVRGDAKRIQERRQGKGQLTPRVTPFRGSMSVVDPERLAPGTERKNEDLLANLKAQGWWHLRNLFQHTFRAINGLDHDRNSLISLSRDIKDLQKLCIELSQPKWKMLSSGKLAVDKAPDGASSPNRADSIMILMAPKHGAGLKMSRRLIAPGARHAA